MTDILKESHGLFCGEDTDGGWLQSGKGAFCWVWKEDSSQGWCQGF